MSSNNNKEGKKTKEFVVEDNQQPSEYEIEEQDTIQYIGVEERKNVDSSFFIKNAPDFQRYGYLSSLFS